MNTFGDRETALAQIANSSATSAALRAHIQEILTGAAFKGSHRSGQFLTYIVEQAIGGHFESLKERVIGIELFGRSPTYDTSEDAIVRVTASDVRKRLLQHYGRSGDASEFRINLPLGSYLPEIIYTQHTEGDRHDAHKAQYEQPVAPVNKAFASSVTAEPRFNRPETSGPALPAVVSETGLSPVKTRRQWLLLAASLVVLNAAVWGLLWRHSSQNESPRAFSLPWSAFFSSSHPIHLVTSDPDIFAVQVLTHSRISVSDYANHNYIPADSDVSPEVKEICLKLLTGDKATTIDAQIAANVAGVARNVAKTIAVQGARGFQFSDLKTDDNYIFLGSPSSDPWFSVFSDQLDFRIVPSQGPGGEMIQNVRPRANEQPFYSPTARGGATGESFAVVAFVANRDQYGQVLLLAGLNREGTEAAGRLVTDLPRLSSALQTCGISPAGPLKHFEMILRVNTLAGSPSQFDVLACHVLADSSAS